MDIQYLYEFTVLADAGNFLEAAERLFISQSSLSKHIKSLEKEFGATLFDRTTRRVSLNDAGHILLPYAKKIVIAENSAKDALRKQQEENTQTLTISSLPVMGQYNITALLADYKREFPKVILHIRDSETVDLKNLLERGKYDLAFMRDTLDDDDSLARIPFAHDTLAAILPITHPLANKEKISLSALKDESFIFLPTHTKISGL